MNLGIMNGWDDEPAEYKRHLAECGCSYEYKYMTGKPGSFEMRIGRKYNLTVAQTQSKCGSWTTIHCHDCGCSWEIDSSD